MTVRNKTLAIALAVAVCAVASSPSPRAAGFDARPVTIETRGGNVAAITVTNPGDRKIYLQNSVQEWRQGPSGQDLLRDTPAAILSPPRMWGQPGAPYNLRIQLPPARDPELALPRVLPQLPGKSRAQARRI